MIEPSLQTLGRYTIRAEIGRGGFATVYQALDTSLNREVALKVLHPQMSADRSFVERFRKEARTLASLRHPHIITVYEVSEVEGRLFIAMELAHGLSLANAIGDRKRFAWADALAILKPVCEALDYAHGQGVVHRDLKPANVLLDAERGPLLTDFGFARLLSDSSTSMSLSGGILGTPAYIAPEVWELDTATPAADIYALGCIAYEMLTGDVLFVGKTPMQSMRAHDRGPQFPATWPEDVPPGVAAALQVALARKPENRYPKATTFWHALNDLDANAQAAREQTERQAVADQWKAEVTAAMAAGEWSAAKMAVGRWLSITPNDPVALAMRDEIARRMEQEEQEAREARKTQIAEAAVAAEVARKAQEELEARRTTQEAKAARKAKEEKAKPEAKKQERQTALAGAERTPQSENSTMAPRQTLPTALSDTGVLRPRAHTKLIFGLGGLGIFLIALLALGLASSGVFVSATPTPVFTLVPTSSSSGEAAPISTLTTMPTPALTVVLPNTPTSAVMATLTGVPASTLTATLTSTPTSTLTATPTIRRIPRGTATATPHPPCPQNYFWNPVMNRCQSSGGSGAKPPTNYP
jgi:eukaryotic-like serine/threonine-protein kinase